MLYEMIAVVRVGSLNEVKEIARTAGAIVLHSGGVVRGIKNWGPFLLTKPKVRAQVKHDSGHHFIMRYDCSPQTNELVQKTVAVDPRMLRCGVVKLGSTLAEIMDVPGKAPWRRGNETFSLLASERAIDFYST